MNNLSKEMKDLCSENYKTFMKKIEDHTTKLKDSLCSWIGRINVITMAMLPQMLYRFNVISIKILTVFFAEIEKVILKFIWNFKGLNNQKNLEKEQSWRICSSQFQNIL